MEDLARDKLPDGKILFPGGIDDTTYFIEHPELVAERIVRFAKLVGKENVIACTDCGLRHLPDASLAFAKLYALAEAPDWRPPSCGLDNQG
jgi:5-methyltetrahydropteroyltriglutamate--homocysteine methyltransferase